MGEIGDEAGPSAPKTRAMAPCPMLVLAKPWLKGRYNITLLFFILDITSQTKLLASFLSRVRNIIVFVIE